MEIVKEFGNSKYALTAGLTLVTILTEDEYSISMPFSNRCVGDGQALATYYVLIFNINYDLSYLND